MQARRENRSDQCWDGGHGFGAQALGWRVAAAYGHLPSGAAMGNGYLTCAAASIAEGSAHITKPFVLFPNKVGSLESYVDNI